MSLFIRLTFICLILILTISIGYTKQRDIPCSECTNSTSVIALILARGGSKGILKKNLMPVNGVSLLGRTIQTINASKLFPEIWVSTDEEAIKNEATKFTQHGIHHSADFEICASELNKNENANGITLNLCAVVQTWQLIVGPLHSCQQHIRLIRHIRLIIKFYNYAFHNKLTYTADKTFQIVLNDYGDICLIYLLSGNHVVKRNLFDHFKDFSFNGALVHIRPESVSRDYTTSIDSTREFMQKHKYIKKLALFQCTSVFLKLDYVIKAFELFKTSECVFATTRSFKLRWSLNADGSLVPLNFDPKNRPRRQDWSGELVETGMFYFANRDLIEQNVFQSDRCSNVVVSPRDSLEIDTANDLNVARCIVEKENLALGKN